jgi:hypothetical protein
VVVPSIKALASISVSAVAVISTIPLPDCTISGGPVTVPAVEKWAVRLSDESQLASFPGRTKCHPNSPAATLKLASQVPLLENDVGSWES